MMPPVPPWAVGNTPEPVSLDIDCFVDVTPYVRFETGHSDIDYGVLDIQVSFQHEGRHTSVYLLHYFALAENYPKCGAVIAGWVDNFDFPPALAKMIVRYQERTINVCVQYCLAVNDRSSEVPGPFFWRKWQKRDSGFGIRDSGPCPSGRAGPSFRDWACGLRRYPDHFFWRKWQKRDSGFGIRDSGPCPSGRAGPSFRDSACGLRRYPDHFFGENGTNVIRDSGFVIRAPAPRAGPGQAFGIRLVVFGGARTIFLAKMSET